MSIQAQHLRWVLFAAFASGLVASAGAADIGQIKVAKGQVSIERSGQVVPGSAGARLQAADVLRTGADGSVGLTMSDNSLLSIGPNSVRQRRNERAVAGAAASARARPGVVGLPRGN